MIAGKRGVLMKAVKFLREHLPPGANEDHNESPSTAEPVSSWH
jgi:hypothetical protein